MNINIMKQVAHLHPSMKDMVQAVEMGGCPFCKSIVTTDQFSTWDALSQREFRISGICKPCQDKFFA
jgi:hypothetical protein